MENVQYCASMITPLVYEETNEYWIILNEHGQILTPFSIASMPIYTIIFTFMCSQRKADRNTNYKFFSKVWTRIKVFVVGIAFFLATVSRTILLHPWIFSCPGSSSGDWLTDRHFRIWTQKVTFETCDKKTKKQKDEKTINQKGKRAKQEFYILMSGAVLHSWGVLGYEQHFYFFPKPASQWTHFYPYIKSLSLCSMYSVQNIPYKSLFDLKNMLQYSFYKYKEKKMG